jgi:hypothetical protein
MLRACLPPRGTHRPILVHGFARSCNPLVTQGNEDDRFTVKQRNQIHEEYQQKMDVLKRENGSLRAELAASRKQSSKVDEPCPLTPLCVVCSKATLQVNTEVAQARSMLRGHNDLVMSSKLREVEIEKVKEFATLVQSDLEQADEDQTALEIALQEERQKRVELEKGRGGKKGEVGAKPARDEVASVRKEGKLEVAAVQRQADAAQRELGLQQDPDRPLPVHAPPSLALSVHSYIPRNANPNSHRRTSMLASVLFTKLVCVK